MKKLNSNFLTKERIQEFNELFDRQERKDHNFHFGFETWDDIRVNTLTHLASKIEMFDSSKEFKPWANTIIVNQIKNQKRDWAARNIKYQKSFTNHSSLFGVLSSINNDPVGEIHDKEKLEKLRLLISCVWNNLDRFEKKLLIRKFKKNLSSRELAPLYNGSYKRVLYQVNRILNKISKIALKNDFHIRGLKVDRLK